MLIFETKSCGNSLVLFASVIAGIESSSEVVDEASTLEPVPWLKLAQAGVRGHVNIYLSFIFLVCCLIWL